MHIFILNKGMMFCEFLWNIIEKFLCSSARVGYEQIYRALYDGLGMRVHVEQNTYEFFSCLPIIQETLTTDSTETRLHACRSSSNSNEPCSIFRYCDKPIRVFLSIMWFTEQIAAHELLIEYHEYHSNFDQTQSKRLLGYQDYEPMKFRDKYLNYRLCYSLHSSFSEIIDVLKTLKPHRVTPIAEPLPSLLPTKQFYQLIDYFLGRKINEKLVKKLPINYVQIKHRYESFETKFERKRRRRFLKEQQKRKANGEELDFGANEEQQDDFLRRITSIIK